MTGTDDADYASLDAIARSLRADGLHCLAIRVECASAIQRKMMLVLNDVTRKSQCDAQAIAGAPNVVRLERRAVS